MTDDNGETIGFRFCPDKVSEATDEAVRLLWLAGISAAGIKLQERMEKWPPKDLDKEAMQRWRRNKQATLSEIRLQLIHFLGDDSSESDKPSLPVFTETHRVAQLCVKSYMHEAIATAIYHAEIAAEDQLQEASEAIDPTPPAPQPSRIQRLRARVGNALWSAGDGLHGFSERAGNAIGRMLRSPLAWLAGLISPDEEL
jgi:hypothetical protein